MPDGPRDPRLIGRGREIDALTARLAAAGGAVLITGVAGVGKTTLIEGALRTVGTTPVARGYCPAEPSPPLWPWRSALRRAGIEIEHGGIGHRDVEAAAASSARFAALARMTDALLASGPVIVVLEDMHWSDAASLDLLDQVAAATEGSGLTVIATARTPADADVELRLAALNRYGGVVAISLSTFTPAEVAEVVGAGLADDVYARTGGLPLLVGAMRDGVEAADLAGVVRRLLAGLTSQQRGVVETAAVLGEHVDEATLRAVVNAGADGEAVAGAEIGKVHIDAGIADANNVAGVASVDVAPALTAAWRGGVLVEDAGGRTYRFAHALIRDEIVRHLEPAVRRRLARSAATGLAASAAPVDETPIGDGSPLRASDRTGLAGPGGDGDARAAQIAALWRGAGTDPYARRAAAYWSRRAAAAARASHSYDDAARHLSDALADLSAVGAADSARAEALLELARVEFVAGHYDRCLDRCADAADAADAAGREDLVALSAVVLQGVNYPRAAQVLVRLCRRALEFELPSPLRARVLAQLAVVEADSGHVDVADPLARESLALARSSADPQAEVEAARAREMTVVHARDYAERAQLGELVASRAESLGQPIAAIIGHGWRVRAAYENAQLDVVDSATEAVIHLADRSRLPLAQWHRHRLLASRSVLAGRFTESVHHSVLATDIARASGDIVAAAMYYAHGLHLAVLRGDPAALPDGYREALAAAPSMPLVEVQRANACVLAGEESDAHAIYERLRALLPIPYVHPAWPALLTQMVDLTTHFQDAATARIAYAQLLPFRAYPGAFGTPTVYFTGSISRYLGELAATFGDLDCAEELLREALIRNRAVEAAPDVALTSLDLAQVLRRGGPTSLPEVRRRASDALRIATELDMPATASAARALITSVRNDADPLTAREREVARLVAQALTNRQIATALVLSERTIESHVRSVLAKTGCANRTELVARWTDVG